MSTRINLTSFDCPKLFSLFGSKDVTAIKNLHSKLLDLEDYGALTAKECRLAQDALTRSVQGGVPIKELVNEGPGHVELASLLAQYKQRHGTLDCDFKYFGVAALWERFKPGMAEPGRSLFGVLIHGRPLFGSKLPAWLATRYGYLTNQELSPVIEALQSLDSCYLTDPDVEEVVSSYLKILRRVRSKSRDAWIYVC